MLPRYFAKIKDLRVSDNAEIQVIDLFNLEYGFMTKAQIRQAIKSKKMNFVNMEYSDNSLQMKDKTKKLKENLMRTGTDLKKKILLSIPNAEIQFRHMDMVELYQHEVQRNPYENHEIGSNEFYAITNIFISTPDGSKIEGFYGYTYNGLYVAIEGKNTVSQITTSLNIEYYGDYEKVFSAVYNYILDTWDKPNKIREICSESNVSQGYREYFGLAKVKQSVRPVCSGISEKYHLTNPIG